MSHNRLNFKNATLERSDFMRQLPQWVVIFIIAGGLYAVVGYHDFDCFVLQVGEVREA